MCISLNLLLRKEDADGLSFNPNITVTQDSYRLLKFSCTFQSNCLDSIYGSS